MAAKKTLGKMVRIVKKGVPTYVAPWYKDLTSNGKSLIGQNDIMKPYGKYMYLTASK